MNSAKQINRHKGFTLVELLVVIAIIGILSSVVMASISTARDKARIANAQATLDQVRRAVAILEGDTGQWPGHKTIVDIEGGASGNEIWDLNAPAAGLVQTDGNFPNWNGPYLPVVPTDKWGNNYFFDTDYDIDPTAGTRWAVVIGSFGPNGVGQNVYDSDDIIEIIVSE